MSAMRRNIYKPPDSEAKYSGYRLAIGAVMFFAGIAAVSVVEDSTGRTSTLVSKIGLAFIVAGVVMLIREVVFLYVTPPRPDPPTPPGCPRKSGLRVVAMVRRGYWGYHTWYLNHSRQELLISGRSVLHRVCEDFRTRSMSSVEEALHRKLKERSSIKIVFCDPRWDLLPKLAQREGEPVERLYENLAMSMAIVKRTWLRIKKEQLGGDMHISLSDELLQYAIHYTRGIDTAEDLQVLIGLYFAKKEGCDSPLFEANDPRIQSEFRNHFMDLHQNSQKLLQYPLEGAGRNFNESLFNKVIDFLRDKLGDDFIDGILP